MDAAIATGLEILAALLSLGGCVLLAHKRRIGWLAWILADAIWVWVDVRAELWSQAALFAVYTGMSAWGWWRWRRERQ